MAQEIKPNLTELIGRRCWCEFVVARRGATEVIVDAVAMPMIKIRDMRGGDNHPYWINVSQIATLQLVVEYHLGGAMMPQVPSNGA